MPQTPPTFSDLASDYAIPRAILGPQIRPAMALTAHSTVRPQNCQHLRPHRPGPPSASMHNPSTLHPVFFTENLQRRRSFGHDAMQSAPPPATRPTPYQDTASQPYHTQHTPFTQLAPPAPPLPHASSPVAHGYIYRESPSWPILQRSSPVGIGTGTGSKLACVAHNTTILAECIASASSQTSSLASLVLPKIDHKTAQKLTFTHGSNHIHYIAEAPNQDGNGSSHSSAGGLTFLVVAEGSLGRRIPFAFLVAVRSQFFADFPADVTDFADMPNYGAASFNGTLKALMVQFGTSSEEDAISAVRRDIDDVRGIMGRNIESLMERGERIDLLVDQTDRLGGSARDFRVRSRGLKRQMWWKNTKLMALIGLVFLLVLLTIIFSVKS
ncbi:hypothetical protein SEPCBS119000_003439 [Sporothrix epigloea]|uniref:Synaptobrevin homolog YKT6 n=1 Tax=Sporothrix epigloea TaxID=1892477 RepID=A0ABP0DLM6_9PEZI